MVSFPLDSGTGGAFDDSQEYNAAIKHTVASGKLHMLDCGCVEGHTLVEHNLCVRPLRPWHGTAGLVCLGLCPGVLYLQWV